ncbi:MAG: glycosyltransferase [Solirubrobacteraceae bacterium]|nr:glycosyltransferase [Solirubrobacteraceae bacterium]
MTVTVLDDLAVPPLAVERFEPFLSAAQYADLLDAAALARLILHDRVLWCVNSTARGGGVAEMLGSLLGYARGSGVDARWVTIDCPAEFLAVTKRLHHRLHGFPGDGGPLGEAERAIYEEVSAENVAGLVDRVRPGDVVLLHDPQTAGLVPELKARGAAVIWRLHIGADVPNDHVVGARDFLMPYVRHAHACVFSRAQFIWPEIDADRCRVVAPSIDALSPKNQPMEPATVTAILQSTGLLGDGLPVDSAFLRRDRSPGRVERRAWLIEDAPTPPDVPLVAQVSRWDDLKDPMGVVSGFVGALHDLGDAHLIVAGPDVAAVTDDPEGARVLREVTELWQGLSPEQRSRVHLATLPMDDPEENAAIVNALQRRADVVVQKSRAEGFGLTVAEAMWKSRAVLATRVGGIQDQIVDGLSGVLLDDPDDLETFGRKLSLLIYDGGYRARLGAAARERVRDQFLESRHLQDWVALLREVAPAG